MVFIYSHLNLVTSSKITNARVISSFNVEEGDHPGVFIGCKVVWDLDHLYSGTSFININHLNYEVPNFYN